MSGKKLYVKYVDIASNFCLLLLLTIFGILVFQVLLNAEREVIRIYKNISLYYVLKLEDIC